jgi:hypothetical protein
MNTLYISEELAAFILGAEVKLEAADSYFNNDPPSGAGVSQLV